MWTYAFLSSTGSFGVELELKSLNLELLINSEYLDKNAERPGLC